ncbi:MAG: hypothetical protein U9N82_01770 [Thermodesulfobacteriota bacterium]|nr:hypothetical protein [Thermodesulfobacteriota bacterium]
MSAIYANHGSDKFNARMHDVSMRIGADVEKALGNNFVALLLGGGYGRGEGGVVRVDGVEQPYNDLDFTLIVKRKNAVPWDKLDAISEHFEEEIKIDVDFSRPLTLHDVENWPHWLMWYDLLNGHIVIGGPPDILKAHAPAALKETLPAIEATRLVLNRGAGLLWALRVVRGVEKKPDADFIRRNYYKCILAMGDGLLIAHQRFATPYRGRDDRLTLLETDSPEVAAFELGGLYHEALRFKFQPDDLPDPEVGEEKLKDLARRWGDIFLHVEKIRTGRNWVSLTEYSRWRGLREVEQHSIKNLPRNLIRNKQMGILSWKYPRERLYRQLPVLLGLTDQTIPDWPAESGRFLKIWDRFN